MPEVFVAFEVCAELDLAQTVNQIPTCQVSPDRGRVRVLRNIQGRNHQKPDFKRGFVSMIITQHGENPGNVIIQRILRTSPSKAVATHVVCRTDQIEDVVKYALDYTVHLSNPEFQLRAKPHALVPVNLPQTRPVDVTKM